MIAPTTEPYTVTTVTLAIRFDAATGSESHTVQRRLVGQGEADWINVAVPYTVTCGTAYEFQVVPYGDGTTKRAFDGDPSALQPVTIKCPPAPAPSGLSVDGTAQKYSLSLSWSTVPSAEAYKLEMADMEWALAGDDADDLTTTSFTVTGLQCGTEYSFRVSARGDGHPYSMDFGDPTDCSVRQRTADCPEISISSPTITRPIPSDSPVRQYRIFEGGTATFSITSEAEFPDPVAVNINVSHGAAAIDGTVPASFTFPANTRTTTFSLDTVDNSTEEGRELITVTLNDGDGYIVSPSADDASIPVDDDDLELAPAPSNVRISSTLNYHTTVRLDWTRGYNISRYRVEKRLPESLIPAEQDWTSAGAYGILTRDVGVDASIACGLPHEYRVIPVGDGEVYRLFDGHESATLRYTLACPLADTSTGFRSEAETEYSVTLTWTAVRGAHAYKIERSGDGRTDWRVVGTDDDTVAAPATSFVVTGLACDTDHFFRISARGDGRPLSASFGAASAATAAIDTEACPTVSITPGTSPVFEGAEVTFTISLEPAVGVELPVSIAVSQQGAFVATATPTPVPVPANTTSRQLTFPTINDAVGEPRGTFTVTLQPNSALYSINEDASAATVTIEDNDLPIPNPPNDLSISPLANFPTSYRAEWTRADNVADYEVEFRLENAKDWDPFGSYGMRSTIGVSKSLLCGEDYEFQIHALGDGDSKRAVWSDYSTTVDYPTTDCLTIAAPQDLEADNKALTSIDLSWSPVTGAIEYKVEYMAATVEDWTALENEVRAPGVGPFDASPNGTVDPTVTVSDLICRTNYSFRVSARGNGRLYDSEYGPVSDVLAATSTERSYDSCDDRVPSFGSETINDISIDTGETVTPVVLPEATGGDFPLAYSFDNDTPLPEGLEFDDETRILSGTPTMPLCGSPFIYTVTDADPTDPDSDTISFNIFVLDPDIPRPSFNSATVADWTYSITANSTALHLPRATGEFGTLRYSLEPPLPSGMTFDADRLIIYGVPTSTATAREYTYKVRNNADCANTDSDSITFSLDFADPPAHPQFHVRPSGITASGNDEAGTITLSWNPDDNAGYRFRQWDDNTQRFRDIPRDNFTVTCGGRIATVCPPDATSAVISGFTASGAYYHKIAGRSGSNPDWISSSSFTTVTLTISDPQPTFNDATISDMVFIEDRAIDPLTLPIAVGGNGQLDYTLTPDLPDGLSFNPLTRTISGTPDDDLSPGTYTYTVTDSDATNPDTDTIRFMIEVADPEITVTDLPSRMVMDDEVKFTVEVTDTPEIGDIEIVVEAFGGANDTSSTTESDIGFDSNCSDIQDTDSVDSDVMSFTTTFTLRACNAQYNEGGKVKVYLANNGTQISDAVEVDVLVVPKVTINDLSSPVYEDQEIAFTVDVDGLKSTVEYGVKANVYAGENGAQSTTNSDLGFNATSCSEVTKTVDVPSGSTSHTASFTVHVCDSEYDGGIVTITLVDANDNIVAGDWLYLEARPITVRIEADNPFPVTGGTVAERTVTLTAIADAPTGTSFTHQWQEKSGSSWSDISMATNTTYTIASTASTTKTIRVVVKWRDGDSEGFNSTEDEIDISWDMMTTMRHILGALSEAIPTPTPTSSPTPTGKSTSTPRSAAVQTFLETQTTLLGCVNTPARSATLSFVSFADVMAHYSGPTQVVVDNCMSQPSNLWTSIEGSFTAAFAGMQQVGQPNASAIREFLQTEYGASLMTTFTDRDNMKPLLSRFIFPAAESLRSESRARNSQDSGARQGSSSPTNVADCLKRNGLYNALSVPIPTSIRLASVDTKLDVVNCIVFDLRHRFWLQLADSERSGHTAAVTAYKRDVDAIPWLTYGDFRCSLDPRGLPRPFTDFADSVGERAACLRHDMTYDNLQRFAGDQELSEAESDDDSFEIDEVWNPRNRYLADIFHFIDLECSELAGSARSQCLSKPDHLVNALGFISWITNPDARRFWGIAEINDKNFPTTQEDVDHVNGNPIFVQCRQTPIPTVSNIHITISRSFLGSIFMATWAVSGGCGDDDIAVDRVRLCSAELLGSINSCFRSSDTTSSTSRLFGRLPSSFQVDVKIWPENVLYGARNYPKTLYDIVDGESQ